MYPLSDNDMDRLSREASEQFDVEQPTSGWDRLEKKLDKELPREKDRRRFLWFFLMLLLLGGGTLSLILINDQQDKTLSQAAPAQPATGNSNAPAETAAAAPATSGTESNAGTVTETTSLPPASGSANQQAETVPSQTQKESTSANTISSSKNKSIVQTPFRSGNGALALSINSPRKHKKRNTSNSNIPVTDKLNTGNTSKEGTNEVVTSETVETIAPPAGNNTVAPAIAAVTDKAPAATDTASQKPAAAETATTEKAAEAGKKKNPQIPVSKWSIGTTIGADWSRIHGTGDKRMGYNVGILVSYNITDRLSVSTGAIVTRKMYSALGKDFNPPQHYWTSYVKLESLDGYCQMIDIPLNIRYDLSVKGNNRWYASTGLSSYLMTSQYYNYYYYNNANQYTEKNWSNKANSEYWMGILNLSAGYERILNRKWSLQAEPFLKIPLKGVGFGNMDISSYGALFTLKYHPKF